MPNLCKNIEALTTKTVVDMWDQIYMSQSPKFLIFYDGSTYKVRIIGDFVVASRHFIPNDINLGEVLSKEQLEEIVRGNETTYNSVIDKLISSFSENTRKAISKCRATDPRSLSEAKASLSQISDSESLGVKRIKEIDSIFASSNWSKCHLVNVIIREQSTTRTIAKNGEIAILPLTNQILEGIMSSGKTLYGDGMSSMKLGGLVAHDLHISRAAQTGRQRETTSYGTYQKNYTKYNWTINMSPRAEHLTQPEVSTVLKFGAYDLHEAAKYVNRNTASKKSGFLYKIYKTTMNNRQMIGEMIGEQEASDDSQHAELVERNIGNLPDTAFSNRQEPSSIGSLEL